ncbi:MAG TPA: hypothetical protein VMD76_03595 [Candidatus Sulfotelmatobacter sp.]|jgi:hypothetical protein|nr:hypothetical protein [Candidatus Sulfotelmatobacter sp.]
MTPGRIVCALAVLAVLCVLSIFFFPGLQGPYSVVHGPVTALLSLQAAATLRVRIVRAGLNAVRSRFSSASMALVPLTWASRLAKEFRESSSSHASNAVLRC